MKERITETADYSKKLSALICSFSLMISQENIRKENGKQMILENKEKQMEIISKHRISSHLQWKQMWYKTEKAFMEEIYGKQKANAAQEATAMSFQDNMQQERGYLKV